MYNGVKKTITDYIKGVREQIMQTNDSVFLQELLTQWNKHRTAICMIRDILMYMVCHLSFSIMTLFPQRIKIMFLNIKKLLYMH